AEHVISFGTEVGADSLAFVGGIPIFTRFFLGGEDSIRGFNIRSLSPIALVEQFVTSQNVQAFKLGSGNTNPLPILKGPRRIRGIAQSVIDQFTYTNKFQPSVTGQPEYTPIGADTQLLYNLEYRIPIAGPLSVAAFIDAGTAFNTAQLKDQ